MTLMVKMSKVVKEPKTSVLVAGFEQAYQASNERVDSAR
jgi:putative heme iron utilization protein